MEGATELVLENARKCFHVHASGVHRIYTPPENFIQQQGHGHSDHRICLNQVRIGPRLKVRHCMLPVAGGGVTCNGWWEVTAGETRDYYLRALA